MTIAAATSSPIPLDLIIEAPKVLLHDHLDGGLRPQTVLDLAAESGYADLPASDAGRRLSEHLEVTFREAAQSHPEYPDVQYRCGRLLARLGRQADAVEHLQRAVRLNDRFVKARLALAACYEDIEQPDQAAKQLELALEQGAQHPDVHYRLGRCYRALGRPREAAEALGRATAINPGYVAAHKALRELSTQTPPGEPGLA